MQIPAARDMWRWTVVNDHSWQKLFTRYWCKISHQWTSCCLCQKRRTWITNSQNYISPCKKIKDNFQIITKSDLDYLLTYDKTNCYICVFIICKKISKHVVFCIFSIPAKIEESLLITIEDWQFTLISAFFSYSKNLRFLNWLSFSKSE